MHPLNIPCQYVLSNTSSQYNQPSSYKVYHRYLVSRRIPLTSSPLSHHQLSTLPLPWSSRAHDLHPIDDPSVPPLDPSTTGLMTASKYDTTDASTVVTTNEIPTIKSLQTDAGIMKATSSSSSSSSSQVATPKSIVKVTPLPSLASYIPLHYPPISCFFLFLFRLLFPLLFF